MSEYTLPADVRRDGDGCAGVLDLRTDDGLRQALEVILRAESWDLPVAHALLAEIRRRAARNASHVASTTGVTHDRGLVDDVLLAAWMVLRRHGGKVLAAARPWAYLMSSAQKYLLDEVRAQRLLTNTASIRGRTREVLPRVVRPVGSTATDLATALRHEPSGADTGGGEHGVRQVGRHGQPPLVAASDERTATVSVGGASRGSPRSSTCWLGTAPREPPPRRRSTGSPICSPLHMLAGGNGPLAATRSWRGWA